MNNSKPNVCHPVLLRQAAYLLLVGDVLALWVCFNLASLLRLGEGLGMGNWSLVWPLTFVLLSLYVFDTYAPDRFASGVWAAVRSIVAVVGAGILISLFVYLAGLWGLYAVFGRGIFATALFLFLPWAVFSRYYSALWSQRYRSSVRWLVLGLGESVNQLYRDFQASGIGGTVEFLARDAGELNTSPLPGILGVVDDIDRVNLLSYTGIVLTRANILSDALAKQLMDLRMRGMWIYDISDFYEGVWHKVPVLHLKEGWFVFSRGFDLLHNPIGMRMKRVLDVAIAAVGLVVATPLVLIAAIAIRMESPGPAIYRQERKGENGRIFVLYKLRSMYADPTASQSRWTVKGDPRITRVGRFIRLIRLDELPQLVNVIRGDMSFIGPRPEARELTALYEREIPFYDLRYLVKPGITGWAQVMYPYGSSVEDAREKLQYDLFYIKNYSLLLDLAILLKTIRVVLSGRGR